MIKKNNNTKRMNAIRCTRLSRSDRISGQSAGGGHWFLGDIPRYRASDDHFVLSSMQGLSDWFWRRWAVEFGVLAWSLDLGRALLEWVEVERWWPYSIAWWCSSLRRHTCSTMGESTGNQQTSPCI